MIQFNGILLLIYFYVMPWLTYPAARMSDNFLLSSHVISFLFLHMLLRPYLLKRFLFTKSSCFLSFLFPLFLFFLYPLIGYFLPYSIEKSNDNFNHLVFPSFIYSSLQLKVFGAFFFFILYIAYVNTFLVIFSDLSFCVSLIILRG